VVPVAVVAGARRLPRWLRTAAALHRLALASVVANVVIVVTGGAVRLTDSGLGCPTWPRCTDASLTPTRAYAAHGIIEFANRQLTFVLAIVAVLTWICAMARREQRGLATAALLGIPAQAVLGGLTVLTHLNPWLVAAHFLLSMTILSVTFALWDRTRARTGAGMRAPAARPLAALTTAVAAAVLVVGTVVTGSGPHAGDLNASGKVHRTGLDVQSMAQLHADLVMVLLGLSAGLVALLTAVRAPRSARRAAAVLLGVELAQGGIGYAQYFLDVPPLLVAVHMLGACLVWLAALAALSATRPSQQPAQGVDQQPRQRADHGAVDADELQVAPHL
jgi:cytochrome c oxidase assembly protein subunit 15